MSGALSPNGIGPLHHAQTAPDPLPPPATPILHTAIPIAATLAWLFLTSPNTLRRHHAALWLTHPVTYTIYALTLPAHPSHPTLNTLTRHGPLPPRAPRPGTDPSRPWTTCAPPPKPDFVSGHRWAKVNDVAATSSDIGV